jgi:hypothetical protein
MYGILHHCDINTINSQLCAIIDFKHLHPDSVRGCVGIAIMALFFFIVMLLASLGMISHDHAKYSASVKTQSMSSPRLKRGVVYTNVVAGLIAAFYAAVTFGYALGSDFGLLVYDAVLPINTVPTLGVCLVLLLIIRYWYGQQKYSLTHINLALVIGYLLSDVGLVAMSGAKVITASVAMVSLSNVVVALVVYLSYPCMVKPLGKLHSWLLKNNVTTQNSDSTELSVSLRTLQYIVISKRVIALICNGECQRCLYWTLCLF